MDWDSEEEAQELTPPPANLAEALAALEALGDPERAAAFAKRHKIRREVLGCAPAELSDLAGAWRAGLSLEARLNLAEELWQSGSFDARILATKLLTQARIRPDDAAVWDRLTTWVADLDHPLLAEHLARAAERRVSADPERLEELNAWLSAENPWHRRSALLFTLPWTRLAHPKAADEAILARLLTWAETLTQDDTRLVQQAVAQWLRELSRRNPSLVHAFLTEHGRNLPIFARIEAAQLLKEPVIYTQPEEEAEGDEDDLDADFDDEDWDDEDEDEDNSPR